MARRMECKDISPLLGNEHELKEPRKQNGAGQDVEKFGHASPAPLSDDYLALKLVERFGRELRYVAVWNRWLRYSTSLCTWQFEETLAVFDMARAICREAYRNNVSQRGAALLTSARTVAAVVQLARVDRYVAATSQQWDTDPWLLNTPDGAIDLRTETLPRPRPHAYCTKSTAVAPGDGGCPLWLCFLDRITAGDVELQAFLQRMAGYMLTGSTEEHALFFMWGTGANGKSVFLATLAGVFGGYATTAPIETFTASSHDRHPTDLAMLRGARLVTATETEEGRRWAEAKIKQMTGGDKISARFMRQDFFEYLPAFKLLIAGNHKPGLRSVDEAIRRRFHLVPFTVTIPPDERDPKLADKLRSEWPAILQWVIDGYHDWIERGLAPPEAVRAATNTYLESEDATAAWIEDCCERKQTSWEPASALYASFKGWADKAGEHVPSQKRFGQTLEARNVIPERTMGARGYRGLQIIQPYGNKDWEPD